MNLNEWEIMVVKTALQDAYKRINSSREIDMCEFLNLVEDVYMEKVQDFFGCYECDDLFDWDK